LTARNLLEEHGYLATQFIKQGYFNAKFRVYINDRETPLTGWYLPIDAALFQDTEERKSGILLNIQDVCIYTETLNTSF
jgi:hypothetical protein